MSLPLAGETSHSWNTPPNSAGSRRDQKSTTRQSSSCFDSGQITIALWISQTPQDCVGERGSTGVWEVSGPESKLALWYLRWSRPAHLHLRGLLPVRRFPSTAESPRFPSAPETLHCQSTPETLRCQSAPETLRFPGVLQCLLRPALQSLGRNSAGSVQLPRAPAGSVRLPRAPAGPVRLPRAPAGPVRLPRAPKDKASRAPSNVRASRAPTNVRAS